MSTAAEKRLNRLLAELSRPSTRETLDDLVATPPPPRDFLDRSFPEQCAFIEDPARLKALLATRRSGKSYGAGLYLFKVADANPRCSVVYFGLTRESAKRIMWKPVLERIDREFNIGSKFNLSELSVTLPNGSTIYLIGVDSGEKEMRKVFGQKHKLVIIDEAALYTIDLTNLVYSVLQPAASDERGTICLSGMPSNLKRGLFYDLTHEQEDKDNGFFFQYDVDVPPGEQPRRWSVRDTNNGGEWSCHFWTGFENPHMREQWTTDIAEKKRVNPRIEETPLFQQEWLGKWVTDSDKFVYKYDRNRNSFNGRLPEYPSGEWHYIFGCDLGYEDPTSFTVGAYHDHGRELYVLESWSRSKLDITAVASHVFELMDRYEFETMIVDGANKQAVEELKRRHQIPFRAADKTGKVDFIELMNGDLISGYIKIDDSRCADLVNEYGELIWDDKSAKKQEHPACANHCADGTLYMWRYAYAYLSEKLNTLPAKGSASWHEREMKKLEQDLSDQIEQQYIEEQNAVIDAWLEDRG